MRKLHPTTYIMLVMCAVAVVTGLLGIDFFGLFMTALKWGGLALLAVLVALVVVIVLRVRLLPRRFLADRSRAEAALSRGDLATARTLYERWWPTRLPPSFDEALFGRAKTLALGGEVPAAIELLEHEHAKRTPPPAWLTADLARYHALLGHVDKARDLLAAAEQREGADAHDAALFAFARAVIECRSGQHGNAARILDDHWPAVERLISGQALRPWRVLRAFAQTHGGTQPGGWSETVLASVRPAYPREHAWLATSWPEMGRFLDDKGIA